ncbi:MAG: polyprenyl synthetase family protein [Deltaproteobacteria bacterium]|nr:polyprenyl synthetase family protein [Deltaproteobacteria bacterium]
MQYPEILDQYRLRAEQGLKEIFDRSTGPAPLLQAMGYSLFAGGKRVRPVLVLAACETFAPGGPDPLPAACAIEYIHTYSLIHDDLPAMDNDDFRRGRPTSHKAFGEAMAILSGDALLTEAFGLVARSYRDAGGSLAADLLAELAMAAGSAGMVGGQVLDTLYTNRHASQSDVETTHGMKTGAIITAAVRCGAILGGADEDELAALTRYGNRIGLAFQVADDVLDVVGSRESLGKTAGKDEAQGKSTFPALLGLERSLGYLHRLSTEAHAAISRFGVRGGALAAMAEFIEGMPEPRPNGRAIPHATPRTAAHRAP